jgi:hypothetical protein
MILCAKSLYILVWTKKIDPVWESKDLNREELL